MFTIDKLTQATADFQHYVEPQLYNSGMFDPNNSYVVACEGDTDDLKSKMDMYAGIDMCTIDTKNQVVQGVASRIQYGHCWETFTIRTKTDRGNYETELFKRLRAVKNGDMYPTWTIQSYIEPDDEDPKKKLCTVGIVRTYDLFDFVSEQLNSEHFKSIDDFIETLHYSPNIGQMRIRRNYGGGAIFLSCSWGDLIKANQKVTILKGVFDN